MDKKIKKVDSIEDLLKPEIPRWFKYTLNMSYYVTQASYLGGLSYITLNLPDLPGNLENSKAVMEILYRGFLVIVLGAAIMPAVITGLYQKVSNDLAYKLSKKPLSGRKINLEDFYYDGSNITKLD